MSEPKSDASFEPVVAKYRYTFTLPESVDVLLQDVSIPDELRSPNYNPRRQLRVPCVDLLWGASPSIPAHLLTRLCPLDLADSSKLRGRRFGVNAQKVALRYHPHETKKEIDEAPSAKSAHPAEAEVTSLPDQGFEAKGDTPATSDESPSTSEEKQKLQVDSSQEKSDPPQVTEPDAKGELKAKDQPVGDVTVEAEATMVEEKQKEPAKRPKASGFFNRLPVFQRKTEASDASKVESGDKDVREAPPVQSSHPEPDPVGAPEVIKDSVPTEVPEYSPQPSVDPSAIEAVSSAPASEGEEKLQALWLSDHVMDVQEILSRCSDLPGISTCILTRGTDVLATSRVPAGFDIVALTAHATEMIDGMRAAASRMGLGDVAAVTIHSDKGPVSVFHSGDLALLTLHADRGFTPGVRERLASTLDILKDEGNLRLPGSNDNSQQSEEAK